MNATPVIRIEQGDARRLDIASGAARLVVTSPPYYALRDYGEPDEIGAEQTPDDYVKAILAVLDECARVLTRDGNVFVVIGDKVARTGGVDRKPRGRGQGADPGGRAHTRPVQRGVPGVPDGSLVGIPYRVALAAIEHGWLWRQDIVWAKPNPLPESVRRRGQRAHETVLHLTRSAQNYARSTDKGGELGHDVWTVPVRGYRDPDGYRHSAVYPEALVERAVCDYSEPGDLVVDPFVGSGTTAAVAGRTGRDFYGVDLSADSVACARRRACIERSS